MKPTTTHSTPDPLQLADRRDIEKVDNRSDRHKIDRITAEAEIIEMLAWANFDETTPEWNRLATVLAEYGFTVMISWAANGKLYMKAKDKRIKGLPRIKGLSKPLPQEDAHDLATAVTMHAIRTFRTKVLQHPDPQKRWRPDGGASLRTFFVTWMIMKLPDVYKTWSDARIRLEGGTEPDNQTPTHPGMAGVPGAQLIARETIDEYAAAVGPESMAVYAQKADGITNQEIADQTGTTEGSVRSRIARERKQHLHD